MYKGSFFTNFCSINNQCIRNKVNELELFTIDSKIDILCVSEDWLSPHEVPFYRVIGDLRLATCYCSDSPRGGVAVYARKSVKFQCLDLTEFCVEIEGE